MTTVAVVVVATSVSAGTAAEDVGDAYGWRLPVVVGAAAVAAGIAVAAAAAAGIAVVAGGAGPPPMGTRQWQQACHSGPGETQMAVDGAEDECRECQAGHGHCRPLSRCPGQA